MNIQNVFSEISTQQKGLDHYSPAFWVGEQLKDIVTQTPAAAEIVLQDLQSAGMSLADCEKKIHEFVDKHHTGNSGCCPPQEADRIIREFYGIEAASSRNCPAPETKTDKVVSLFDFM